MTAALTTRARAKINLTLKVVGRRADGYHELESLVAFAGVGDELSLEPAAELSLSIAGPRGAGLEADERNLVLRAAHHLAEEAGPLRWGRFHLVKRLPVASGIGGGSADAAAALRLLARLNAISPADPMLARAALRAGADVPVCLDSRARMMRGAGEALGPVLRLPRLFAVLVNPGIAVETAAVFRKLSLDPAQGHALSQVQAAGSWPLVSAAALTEALSASGNDLQPPACATAPEIAAVLESLAAIPGCRLARMSGSGATCFAIFDDCRASAVAARALRTAQPLWWIKPTVLR